MVPLESFLEVFAIPFVQGRPVIYLQSDNNITMNLEAQMALQYPELLCYSSAYYGHCRFLHAVLDSPVPCVCWKRS